MSDYDVFYLDGDRLQEQVGCLRNESNAVLEALESCVSNTKRVQDVIGANLSSIAKAFEAIVKTMEDQQVTVNLLVDYSEALYAEHKQNMDDELVDFDDVD